MFPVSAQVLAALSGPYEAVTDVWLLRDTPTLVPVAAGTVSASYRSQVARTASLTVDRETYRNLMLTPISDQVMIRVGVKGLPMIPIFTGRIDSINEDLETSSVDLDCVDRGADVIRARFEVPYATTGLQTVTFDMGAILIDVDGSFVASFDPAIIDSPDPVQIWEEDRGEALDNLASAINSIWMADRSGGFTIFRNPYSLPMEPPGVATIENGVGGSTVTVGAVTSRSEVANSVTVVVERTDGAAPVRVTVRDTGATSPTRWGGPFGKQNLIVKNQTLANDSEAQAVAARLLQQRLAATRTWSITTPLFPILDPGDVITVILDGNVTLQVVEQVTYPLDAVGETSITTRQWQFIEEA